MLIFSSATTVTSATVRAQAVDTPETPKLKVSTGEAVLRTTEPPIKNLPSMDEMKRKGKENDDAGKIHKVKSDAEKLPQAVRCRPADKDCQEYWKKQGITINEHRLPAASGNANQFIRQSHCRKSKAIRFIRPFIFQRHSARLFRVPTTNHRSPPTLGGRRRDDDANRRDVWKLANRDHTAAQ